MTATSIGDTLRDRRIELGLRQRDLAERIQCHPVYVHQVECGRKNPSLRWLQRAASALGLALLQPAAQSTRSTDTAGRPE